MEEEVKVSELSVATNVNDEDLIMVVQGGFNKKVSKEDLLKETENEIETLENEIADLYPTDWTYVSLNSNYISNGGLKYAKFGKLVIISLEDIIASSDVSTNKTVLASGLPIPKRQIIFMISRVNTPTADNNCRVAIDTSGNLVNWSDTLYSGSNHYYGQAFYISNE